jgi:hypothetical protein
MTRTGDVAPPTVTPHPLDPDAPVAWWPYRPLIALEFLPQAPYTWDGTDDQFVWDQAESLGYVWDAPFTVRGFTDVVCDFMALDIDPGEPDDLFVFPAVSATLTLANPDGQYTPWSVDGRLTYWAPGRRLHVLVTHVASGERLWLFSGRMASWTVNADDTVTVVAYDGLSWLAQPVGGTWTDGTPGQSPQARITANLAAAAYPDPFVTEGGDVTLDTVAADAAPLERIERVALSDGGLFYGDADGSVRYRSRLWRAGRSDQPRQWAISDNRCDADVVVWAPVMAADDERLATDVYLTNVAGLTATAAAGSGSVWAGDARYRLTHPDPDLWQGQAQGNALATYLLAQQGSPSMAVDAFDVHVMDPSQPAGWDMAARSRRGDRLQVLHDFIDAAGRPGTLDLRAIVLGIAHNLTPDEWVSTFRLSRTVDYAAYLLWDASPYTWDDPNPLNTWRH